MNLSESDQGMFICDALNSLWGQSQDEGCCPKCCAPCGVLQDLDRKGQLDSFVRQAPEHLWKTTFWFPNEVVDRVWLYASWGCQDNPPCEEDVDAS